MIQLSFTKDLHTPVAIYFTENDPDEYHHHFHSYEYLDDSEAIAMLQDEFVTNETKKAIKEALEN